MHSEHVHVSDGQLVRVAERVQCGEAGVHLHAARPDDQQDCVLGGRGQEVLEHLLVDVAGRVFPVRVRLPVHRVPDLEAGVFGGHLVQFGSAKGLGG